MANSALNRSKAQSKERLFDKLYEGAFPLPVVLERLSDAVDHLQTVHNCDRLGHELDGHAAARAKEMVALLRRG